MLPRWILTLTFAAALAAPATGTPGVTVVYHGNCVVAGGVRAQDGTPAKAWDMWQEIYMTGAPTWLGAHTHRGAECITAVYGVTSWWFAHGDRAPNAPPTIVPVAAGETVYTVQGRTHTTGDIGPTLQAYLGIHLLEQGSDFNYPVNDPSAPPQVKTNSYSIFKNEMPNQVPSVGTVTIANQILRVVRGASYPIAASPALGYYTVVAGGATLHEGNVVVAMPPGKTFTLPRNHAAIIVATMATSVAATELIPGAHP
jgi:hypothetical protein